MLKITRKVWSEYIDFKRTRASSRSSSPMHRVLYITTKHWYKPRPGPMVFLVFTAPDSFTRLLSTSSDQGMTYSVFKIDWYILLTQNHISYRSSLDMWFSASKTGTLTTSPRSQAHRRSHRHFNTTTDGTKLYISWILGLQNLRFDPTDCFQILFWVTCLTVWLLLCLCLRGYWT